MKEDDQILIKQLQKGNYLAFNQLYARYFQKLFGFSFKITGNKADAEEIVQEVFIKVWEIRETLDPEKSFNSLLFTIGKHKIYNKARVKIYHQAYIEYITHHVDGIEELAEQEIFFNETQSILTDAINLLPEKRKEIFVLSKIEGLSNKEIAQKMNTSISNIENHINKALKVIRHYMLKNEILIWVFLSCLSLVG